MNLHDEALRHVTKICTNCYQMMKTIIYQIEGIMDTQKILKIESLPMLQPLTFPSPLKREKDVEKIKPEDIAKKYSNLKVRKVSISSASPEKIPKYNDTTLTPIPRSMETSERMIVVEAVPDKQQKVVEVIPEVKQKVATAKIQRALMCISCSQKFTDFSQLQSHSKSCKAPSNLLKCFCGKVMQNKKELAIHVYTEHKDNKRKHICTICKKVFSSLFNLQNHMESHKGNSQLRGTFWCRTCDKKFSDIELWKKHRELMKCGGEKGKIPTEA